MIFLFILPTVLCLLFMYVYPVVRTVIMSFFKVESLTASTSTWSFYGLQNYFKILRNAGFISSIKNMVMQNVENLQWRNNEGANKEIQSEFIKMLNSSNASQRVKDMANKLFMANTFQTI